MKELQNKKTHLQGTQDTENRIKVFSTSNLVNGALILLVISLIVAIIDNILIKPNAIWLLESYDAILIAFWSTLVTLSTLTIAFLAIFTNRLNEHFYGYSVKELLAMNNNCFCLNFFECILIVFLLDGITAIPVVLGSMNAVAAMMIIQIWLIFNVIKMSLLVTMDEAYARNLAKTHVESILQLILNELHPSKCDKAEESSQNEDAPEVNVILTQNEKNLIGIIEKIVLQTKCKLTSSSGVLLQEDVDFAFINRVMRNCTDNQRICDACNNKLLELFNDAMKIEQYKQAIFLSQQLLAYRALNQTRVTVTSICEQYYLGKLPILLFEEWSSSIARISTQRLPEVLEVCLQLQFEFIKNADSKSFQALIAGVNSYRPYQNNLCVAKFFHVMAAYSYYLSLKEPLYLNLHGIEKVKTTKNFMKMGLSLGNKVCKTSDLLNNQDFLIGIIEIFCIIPQRYKGHGAFCFQELHDFSQVYTVHTDNDVQEYVAFILFSIYRNEPEVLNELSYGDLLTMKQYITNEGTIAETHKQAYIHFNDWLAWNVKEKNEALTTALHTALKEKALEQIKITRANTEDFEKRFEALKESLIGAWKKSSFNSGKTERPSEKCYATTRSQIYPLMNGFTFGGLEGLLLPHLYYDAIACNRQYLKTLSTCNDPQKSQGVASCFYTLHEYNNQINFNRIYGERLSEILTPSELALVTAKQIPLFDKKVLLDDAWPVTTPRSMLYINSDIFSPYVFLNEDSVAFQDYLDDKEIEKIVLDSFEKDNGYYITLVDTKIPCTYEEAYHYIRESNYKVVCCADAAMANDWFGVCVEIK